MAYRILRLTIVLGIVLGAAIALVRMSRGVRVDVDDRGARDRRAQDAPAQAPTNRVASSAAPVVTNVAAAAVRTPARAPVLAPTNHTASAAPVRPRRRPITNDPKVPKGRQVLLANRRIAVAKGRSFPKTFCATQTPTRRGTAPYVVISEMPVSRDVRIQAVANGAKVIGFLPNNALLVEVDRQALANFEEDALFMAAVEYEPTDKIQYALLHETGDTVEANIVLMNEKDVAEIQRAVTACGGALLRETPQGGSRICAAVPRTCIESLAGRAEVRWIERHERMRPHNDVAVLPGMMNVTPVRDPPLGLTGEGQIITTSDTGVDTGDLATMHADLRHAITGMAVVVTNGHFCDTHGHGTHTAGSLVGDGTRSDARIRGAAYGAKLFAWCMCDDDDNMWTPYYIYDLFQPTNGVACIHSASWGASDEYVYWYGGWYTEECYDIDSYAWEHPEFLPVFAAGNAGSSRSRYDCTVLTPATAKNILAVGASMSTRNGGVASQIASFSSRGYCVDGRVKPEIVAPGTYILSCLSSRAESRSSWDDGSYTDYQYMGGTSMSTPLTAGTAALVREWLAKYRAEAHPSAALVKAILTGGATDLFYESDNNVRKSVPDSRQGWGRVDLAGTVAPTNGLATFLADWLPFAATSNFMFRLTTTNAAPLNVQLAWVDAPSLTDVGKMLINDLDLKVMTSARTWLGNGGTQPDDVNNIESVRIREAAATTYLIRVRCAQIPYDHTEGGAAALYIRGAFDPEAVERDVRLGTAYTIQ